LIQTPSDGETGVNRLIIAFLVFFSVFSSQIVLADTVGASGQALPRFVSLNTEKANMRSGPGRQYPILWTYKRRLLPLEITAEHGAWRKVRDHEGVEGWILVTLLYGPRTALIRGRVRTLYRDDDMSSAALLTAEPGVIGRILTCTDIWCRLKVGDTKAWIEKRHVWGVYNNEILD
tara:strand:- start:915 stop:1442 length:528 start_codon:yes stop_codon:yes gene_type:complete